MDTVYGVNHNQIESIGHRTVRHLKVAAGGTLRAEPVMLRAPQGQDEVDETRRIVHNAENVYGLIVSLDDKAALIRANFIEGRLDYKRIFDDVNNKVIAPFEGRQRQDLRRRRAAALRLGLPVLGRRLLHPRRHLLHRVGVALDVLPRLARRAASHADGRDRRLLGPRLHPSDRPRPRPADAGDAVPHHGPRREPRHPDARPLLRGVREMRLAQTARDRRRVRRALRADLLRAS